MELGGISTFRYVPRWKGNRELPESQRLSMTIKRMRAVDVLSVPTEDEVYEWRDRAFKDCLSKVADIPIELLRILRLVVRHASEFRNFIYDGEELTSGAEIFGLKLPMPAGEDQDANLMLEINNILGKTSNMTAQELEDFATPFIGKDTPTPTNAKPAVKGEPLSAVSIQPGNGETLRSVTA